MIGPRINRRSARMSDTTAKQNSDALSGDLRRVDPPLIDPSSLWAAISQTPGVGISITDSEGRLLFVNDTAQVLFERTTNIDYHGKRISDFHPPEYVRERLAMIHRVLKESKPLAITHIYHGRKISSTVWPIRDRTPPYNRVIVISYSEANSDAMPFADTCETVKSDYIGLGPLSVLSRRELEVAILLGHGMNVPRVAELLHRSPKTIQRHKASISEKLNVHGQAELVQIITAMGLELDDSKLKRLPETPLTSIHL